MGARLLFILLLSLASPALSAQLQTDNTQTVAWYVENVLLGGGVTVTNITFNGQPADQVNVQVGEFNSAAANVGLTEGIILSTGDIQGAEGPNDTDSATLPEDGLLIPGDPDLDDIAGLETFDAAVLEFDFIPEGDTLRFDYVFASEEYPEFVDGGFNDVFGFFMAGPGLTGPFASPAAFPDGSVNIALIPGTTIPVAIDDVNNGDDNAGPCDNCAYYVENGDGFTAPFDTDPQYIQYDGLTVPLTATAIVECGEVYHIKIVIADAGDATYDSAVFLEAGSFSSTQPIETVLDFDIDNDLAANTLYEGCYPGTLIFTRTTNIDEAQSVDLAVGGTATNGVDYTTIPATIDFAAGQSQYALVVSAITDAVVEGQETVTVSVVGNPQLCVAQQPEAFEFFITDFAPPLTLDGASYDIDCNETVTIGGVLAEDGFGLYDYVWSDGTAGNELTVSPSTTTTYTLIVSDTCVAANAEAEFVVNVATYPDVVVELPDDVLLECGADQATIAADVAEGGSQPLIFEWETNGVDAGNGEDLDITVDQDTEVTLTITDQCGTSASDVLEIDFTAYQSLSIDLQAQYLTDCLSPEVTIVPLSVSGGQGLISYEWQENGVLVSTEEQLTVTTDTTYTEAEILVTISDDCGLVFSDESAVLYQVADPVIISLEAALTLFCNDPTVAIAPNSVSGGQGTLSYQWSVGDAPLTTDYELVTSTTEEVTYTLIVTDECGYEYAATSEVVILPYDTLSIVPAADTIICPGEFITLTAMTQDGLEPISYIWNAGQSISQDITDSPTESTAYSVVASDACGQTVSDALIVEVARLEAGFSLFNRDFYGFATFNSSQHLPGDSITYRWLIDDIEVSTGIDLEMQFGDMEDHTVTLWMENEVGCIDTASAQTTPPPTLYIPSSFTPNADGLNDTFVVKGNNVSDYYIQIRDRWGELVFQSTDIDTPWLGEGASSSEHYGQNEVYAYKVVAYGPNGQLKEYSGRITLLR